jgi:prevent-host-death family protein
MSTVGVSQLRAELRKWLARAEAGDVVEITRDGRVAAVLTHPSVLPRRVRSEAVVAAERLHEMLEEARSRPFKPSRKGLTAKRAEELVRSIREERDRYR